MNSRNLQALAIALGLFVAVYVPTFLIAGMFRPPAFILIPLIIAISFSIAMILIFVLARRESGICAFGLATPSIRYVGFAVVFGLPLACVVAWLSHLFPSKSALDLTSLPAWAPWLYFVFGASIQEETIFRGLIQSTLERRWKTVLSLPGVSLSSAVVFTAVLFGLVHIGNGAAVVAGALMLALVAGELRRRSGSLVAAIIVHALFNAGGAIWP